VSVEVVLPGALADLAGGQRHLCVDAAGSTLAEVLDAVAAVYPRLERRVRDETGAIRRFVNVYVDGEDVRYDGGPAAPVKDGAVIQVLPSVAGG
jgi:molybdopterin synthase sulfur carrier subunit